MTNILEKFGYIKKETANNHVLSSLLYKQLQQTQREDRKFSILQIGANDGISCDDQVYPFIKSHTEQVEGLLIEPMRDAYERLASLYKPLPHIKTLNSAIHQTEKTITIHRLKSSFSKDVQGLASIHAGHKANFRFPPEAYTTETVPCLSMESLATEYHISTIDWLQIDTEGYDIEIIKSIPFDKIRPKIIRFEYTFGHNIMDQEDLNEVFDFLQKQQYFITIEDQDVIAYEFDFLYNGKRFYQRNLLTRLDIDPSLEEKALHDSLISASTISDFIYSQTEFEFFVKVEKWFLQLIEKNTLQKQYSTRFFNQMLATEFFEYCFFGTIFGKAIFKLFWQSNLSQYVNLPLKKKVEFNMRCLLKIKR